MSNLIDISKVIFTFGVHSKNIKDLLPYIRIWSRTLLGYVHHRKPMNYADYINGDQQHILYYISTGKKVNLNSLLFQYLMDMVKETIDGSKKKRNWIPLGRLISNILMESELIDSLTEARIIKELEPQVGKMSSARSMKTMGVIYELTSNHVEVPKEATSNRRIHLEDFPVFTKQDPLNVLLDYLASCQAGAQNKASKTPYTRKTKSYKKHSDGTSKKVNTSSSTRRTLDTSVEEPRAAITTPSAGIVSSKYVPYETQFQSIDNNLSFPYTTILSPSHNPNNFGFITNPRHTTSITTHAEITQFEQVLSKTLPTEPPVFTPQSINTNDALPLPTSSICEPPYIHYHTYTSTTTSIFPSILN